MITRPYIAVHVFDETGKLLEIRECPLTEQPHGIATYMLGHLEKGWNIVVEGIQPETWVMEMGDEGGLRGQSGE